MLLVLEQLLAHADLRWRFKRVENANGLSELLETAHIGVSVVLWLRQSEGNFVHSKIYQIID